MKCLFPHRERRPGKHRFSWGFLSLGSREGTRPPASESKPRALSDPGIEPQALSQSSSQKPPELRAFSFAELKTATKNFSRANLLGEGGFGCVYKGFIKQQNSESLKEVAIKQLNRKGQQGHKEWLAEVRFLGLVEHQHLVKLVGYCAEDDERGIQRLLVYEFMANKSLEEHLFQKGPLSLTWEKRLHILLGAACGLAYLHEEMNGIQVIFRDFKTSNVLLDENFSPKLSDFGLAREGPETGFSHVSTAVVGTIGYAAPEYIQTGHLTSKSDVWSFGIVILEMLSGRRSVDMNRPKDEQKLLDWVKPYLQGNKKIDNIMDPQLAGKYPMLQAQRVASLALQCLAKHLKTRPAMSVVVEKLREIVEMPTTSSSHSERDFARSKSNWRNLNARESKGADIAKRRNLIFKDIMSLKSREDARQALEGWAQKEVPA